MTILFWGLALGLPLLAVGGVALASPSLSRRLADAFSTSKVAAAVMAVAAWAWTAYEIDNYDVNIYREFFVGVPVLWQLMRVFAFMFDHFWFVAPVLAYLTYIWMPQSLAYRAIAGILMLLPAELFATTRLLVPASGFAAVHVFVVLAYVGAIVGMYGMFYPWRLERGVSLAIRSDAGARAFGALCAALGLSLVIIGGTI